MSNPQRKSKTFSRNDRNKKHLPESTAWWNESYERWKGDVYIPKTAINNKEFFPRRQG